MPENTRSNQNTPIPAPKGRPTLTPAMFGGKTPDEFEREVFDYAKRGLHTHARLESERQRWHAELITPIDRPSWGPDWSRRRDGSLPQAREQNKSLRDHLPFTNGNANPNAANSNNKNENPRVAAMAAKEELSDDQLIAQNMEKSRQVESYRPLYVLATFLSLAVMMAAMFVDYNIIREVWTRALSNEFMVVPSALQTSVIFKSLQVVFAVLIVHFMLKLTGTPGRWIMISTAFFLALMMIGGLGYLVAHDSLNGGTATAAVQSKANPFETTSFDPAFMPKADQAGAAAAGNAAKAQKEYSLPIPKLSEKSLNDVSSWFWFAFAGVVFYIVTTVAALFLQIAENNVRNILISYDYKKRTHAFARLHMLDWAKKPAAQSA